MVPGFDPDFGATAGDYATHRADFPESFFARLAALGVGAPGQRLVDLGTGTGTLARGFARRGCRVIGIDPKEAMLAQARRLAEEAGLHGIDYRCATAEETGLPAGSADVVTAGQCWHWFDRPRAAREVARVLDAGGRLAIAHYDWLPLHGNVAEATESLIRAHNPRWNLGGGHGFYPQWLRGLSEEGFRELESFSYDEPAVYAPEAWRGRIRASAGVGASLSSAAVAAFDTALDALLARDFPGARLVIPHRVFVVLARPPALAP
jgi:SAM-dependent methyltransferase